MVDGVQVFRRQTCSPGQDGATILAVSYFTAVIATDAWGWRARDVSVEEAEDLDDLVDRLRAVAVADAPVLAIVEREDDWFALVRVDGEEDPRLFVSDMEAAIHGPFGGILASAADVILGVEADERDDESDDESDDDRPSRDDDPPPTRPAGARSASVSFPESEQNCPDEDGADEDGPDEDDPDEDDLNDVAGVPPEMIDVAPPTAAAEHVGWAGDPDLLEDLGFSGERMRRLAEETEDDPASAIAEIGEEVGFLDLVEALR